MGFFFPILTICEDAYAAVPHRLGLYAARITHGSKLGALISYVIRLRLRTVVRLNLQRWNLV